MNRITVTAGITLTLGLIVLGCGTRFNEALLLAAESGAYTALDVFFADLQTDLPDQATLPPAAGEPGDETDAGGDGGGDAGDGGDTDGGDQDDGQGGIVLVGDPTAGGAFFVANGCSACHCDDGSGGCLPAAPDLRGTIADVIGRKLQEGTTHMGGAFPDTTDQELADVAAFLAGDGGAPDDSGPAAPDPVNGQTLYTANACAVCHCDDGSGDCLPGSPNIQGIDLETIGAMIVGETFHSGGKAPDLTDEELMDMVAFLGG